MIANNTIEEIS